MKIKLETVVFGLLVVVVALFLCVAATYGAYWLGARQAVVEMPTAMSILPLAPFATEAPVPVQPQPAVPSISEWVPYDQAGGIPYNDTTWSVDVAPDELEVFTAGPACIASVCLPGGTERGSVIILLPGSEVIHYEVTGVIAGSNWHGSYRPLGGPASETAWRALANDRVSAMQQAPNCTPGKGCKVIDVLIVGPKGVVARWTVGQ